MNQNAYGIGTLWSSSAYALNANITNNLQSGIDSSASSTYIKNSTISDNGQYGIFNDNNGFVYEANITYSGNTSGDIETEDGSITE